MLEVIKFDDDTYGLRNQMTGQILARDGVVISRRSPEAAARAGRKIAKRLNRAIHKLEKKGKI